MADFLPELFFFGVVGVGLLAGFLYSNAQAGAARTGPRPADPSIDSTPLPGYIRRNYLSNFSVRSLVPCGVDCLELRFGVAAKVGGGISLAVGFWLATSVFLMLQQAPVPGGMALMYVMHGVGAVAFLLSGFYLVFDLGRTTFDRAEGQWTDHRVSGSVTRPLQDILAIQVISGGVQKSEGGDYETFQVNLVVNDADEPRQNLIEYHELRGVQQMARQLAEFLAVPLLDLTPLGDGATLPQPADARVPPPPAPR
jgi:hypothetical protein